MQSYKWIDQLIRILAYGLVRLLSTHNDTVNNRSENVYFSLHKNKVVKLTDSLNAPREILPVRAI